VVELVKGGDVDLGLALEHIIPTVLTYLRVPTSNVKSN